MSKTKKEQQGFEHLILSPEQEKYHLVPLDRIDGFDVRPGFYESMGATPIPGGVNFTVHSSGATAVELLLFHREEEEPFAVLPFPNHYRIGSVYSMIVFGLSIYDFEYAYRIDGPWDPEKGLIFDKTKILLDPYARAITGQSEWGSRKKTHAYHARVVKDDFDWHDFKQPELAVDQLIIYEMHVRGFTKSLTSGVKNPGTFDAIREKIPYLRELGINAVELMPIFEFDEMLDVREYNGNTLYNYWGYNTVGFFAPNTAYTAAIEYNREGNEFKELVKELNENGIEVILDVVFNHTAEGNELGPYISFKGFDNNLYYILTPEGYYYNFSGCGNTMNCNNPVVQQMILECLRYWVIAYRVDGFRFDLASILGRNEDGAPMASPPLLQALAYDPVLSKVKLIAEAWDAGGLYQVGNFPSWNNRWAEWNGRYRDDIRRFLKGDEGIAMGAAIRIAGSPDLYKPDERECASINFITCHDGFTLYDLYSYNEKHNEANGWSNTDGANDNNSWNCGAEGSTDNPNINRLRMRMMKNACAVLMCSRGIPMFLAGDEFGNTQFGNNNPYCQDNEISWLDWSKMKENKELFDFFKEMIVFRKKYSILRRRGLESRVGFPDISYHGVTPWVNDFASYDHYVGVMFAGVRRTASRREEIIYIGVNAYWENLDVELPQLPNGYKWMHVITTSEWKFTDIHRPLENRFGAEARSVNIFVAANY